VGYASEQYIIVARAQQPTVAWRCCKGVNSLIGLQINCSAGGCPAGVRICTVSCSSIARRFWSPYQPWCPSLIALWDAIARCLPVRSNQARYTVIVRFSTSDACLTFTVQQCVPTVPSLVF